MNNDTQKKTESGNGRTEEEIKMQDSDSVDTMTEEKNAQDPEETREQASEASPDTTDAEKEKTSDKAEEEYDELKQEYDTLYEKHLRLAAEFENFKKRMEREFSRRIQFTNEEFLREVLPVLDDLERAVNSTKDSSSFEELKSGVDLVYENFKNVLKRRGVEPIESVGEPFDPELHDAMMVQESDDHDSNVVIDEFERGYRLGDTVLRHAKVVVSK